MEDNGERAKLEGRLYAYDRILAYLLSRLPADEFALLKKVMLEEDSHPEWVSPSDLLLQDEAQAHARIVFSYAQILRGSASEDAAGEGKG